MRKVLVIAAREYKAAVRTKAFVIGLLLMPIMMGGSILVQMLVKNMRDTTDKHFVVVDRTGSGRLAAALERDANDYNSKTEADGKQIKPRLVIKTEEPRAEAEQRLELSERVRTGELVGFLEIASNVYDPPSNKDDESARVRYHTNRPTFMDFQLMAVVTLN